MPYPASAGPHAGIIRLVPRPALLMAGRLASDASFCCDLSLTWTNKMGGSVQMQLPPSIDLKDELGSRSVIFIAIIRLQTYDNHTVLT